MKLFLWLVSGFLLGYLYVSRARLIFVHPEISREELYFTYALAGMGVGLIGFILQIIYERLIKNKRN